MSGVVAIVLAAACVFGIWYAVIAIAKGGQL